jgi:hypothetical protein
MAVTFALPKNIEMQLRAEWPELERRALEGFVAEAFRNGKLSSHEIGEILGFESRWEAIEFLSERGVYPGYDLEDLQSDRRDAERAGITSPE